MARRRSNKYRVPQLSTAEYEKQLAAQNGGCWLCGRKPTTRRLAGDHSHKAHAQGRLVRRGLLCFPCNKYVVGAVERFRVSAERLALYFRTFPD
jgi:hypothetical protein